MNVLTTNSLIPRVLRDVYLKIFGFFGRSSPVSMNKPITVHHLQTTIPAELLDTVVVLTSSHSIFASKIIHTAIIVVILSSLQIQENGEGKEEDHGECQRASRTRHEVRQVYAGLQVNGEDLALRQG